MNNVVNKLPTSLQCLERATMMLTCRFRYLQEKLARYSQRLTFLIRCRNYKLVPKGLRVKLPVSSEKANRIAWRTSLALVRERIEDARKTKATLETEISEILAKLTSTTQPEVLNKILQWATQHKNKESRKSKNRLIKKFEHLLAF